MTYQKSLFKLAKKFAKKKKDTFKRCHWCGEFVGRNAHTTLKEPNIFYCCACYKKGIRMEEEAMGLR